MEKYLVEWENVHNALFTIAYMEYTWLVQMVALLSHEESGAFLGI